ncbi:ATP-binding protein [Treponema peruense]|uniref:ATP-binding protein n=1 Tax=Treponema peruense TaxID=2787628 RepID=A0A7T3RCT0_9SPIR|nr:ATP-binding protein [Treponema peruense]QQA00690.1 ATP-binding protein [Treponema peruense]
MEINRNRYLNTLLRKRNNGLIKIITGIRRCGKSYLLGTIFKNALIDEGIPENHILHMSLDSFENEKNLNPKEFYTWATEKITDNKTYYFLLDEIQLMDRFESVLNGLNEKPNVEVYVTGSNAKFLSKDIATEFAGRGDEIHMYPLSFSEFKSVYNGDNQHALQEYMLWGGIPLVVLAAEEDKAKLLKTLFEETYIRDIILKHKIRNQRELEDLLNILSSSIGSLTNPEKLMNTFRTVKKSKITANTIAKYIEYCEDSFLIESAKRYDIKGKAYIETPQKYYFSDLGLRNVRLGFRQNEPTHIMENIIYNELKIRGFGVDIGVVPVIEKNEKAMSVKKQLEIDFICTMGMKKYYIQSAYSLPDSTKREQEIRPFIKSGDSFKKIVITNDITPPVYDDNGILTINFLDFLNNESILET